MSQTTDQTSLPGWVPRQAFDYETYTSNTVRTADAPLEPTGDWLASSDRYEWKEEYGELAPRNEKLEEMLFGQPDNANAAGGGVGISFDKLLVLKVNVSGLETVEPIEHFTDAPLHPQMLENIKLCRYRIPTPIQRYCIPAILKGHDLVSVAQTGSGKTAAFLMPVLSKLMGKAKKLAAPRPALVDGPRKPGPYTAEPLVLVVSPTRELATQIFDESRRFCYRSMLRPCVVYGGADTVTQRNELAKGCDVLVGTPGRLCDFIGRPGVLSLKRVKFIVVDEADEMLDMGFEPQLRQILQKSDCNQDDDMQVLMFSATFPKNIRQLATEYMSRETITLSVGRIGSTNSNCAQHIIWVDENKKKDALYDLLCEAPPARTLIFVNHKRTADTLDDYLYNLRLPTTSIHSDRTQREREDALIAFRSGKCPILIATGIASRGLDVKNVMHIINYDMCNSIDEYIHRIGRTARIGNHGLATTFYNSNNEEIAEDLVKILMECGMAVPDFLEKFKPDGQPQFDEPDSDGDGNATTEDWGVGDTASSPPATVTKAVPDDGWSNNDRPSKPTDNSGWESVPDTAASS